MPFKTGTTDPQTQTQTNYSAFFQKQLAYVELFPVLPNETLLVFWGNNVVGP